MTIKDSMEIQQDNRSSHADKNDAYRAAVEYNKNRFGISNNPLTK